jgi:Prolyl oligopeptidase family
LKSSPVASIANWHSPVLLIHGDDDRNVPSQQTTDLVEKLRPKNVAFEEPIIPDEIHDLLRWSDWVRATAPLPNFSTEDWLPRANGNKRRGRKAHVVTRNLFLFNGYFGGLNYRKNIIALFEVHSLDRTSRDNRRYISSRSSDRNF